MEFSTVYNVFNTLLKIIWTKIQILAGEVRRLEAIEVSLQTFYQREVLNEIPMAIEEEAVEEEGAAASVDSDQSISRSVNQSVDSDNMEEMENDRHLRIKLMHWYTPPSNFGFSELFTYGARLDVLGAARNKVRTLTTRYRFLMREIVDLKRLIKQARKSELYDAQPGVVRINWVSL